MKHLYLTFLLTVLMSMIGARASAHDIEVANADGVTIYYRWNSDKTELSVTCYGDFPYDLLYEYSGNVVIPSSVTYGGREYSVTSIGEDAFGYCSGLTSVEIPNSVTSIGERAFYACYGLISIEIPHSVTSIGERAFGGCYGLTKIVVASDNTVYDSRNNCNAIIETASNTLITGFQNTIIPNSVTSIGNNAFRGCSGLTSVEIPNSVTSIGNNAFSWCSGLTSVEIPNSVTSIGDYAFFECSGLTSVAIGNSVTSIGDHAFYGCAGLTSVTSLIEEPFDIDTFMFYDDTYTNATLYVPAGTKEKYEATEGWKNFANIVEKDDMGIDAVDAQPASSADAPVYNLNGQRVNAPVNGIYIKNGRKVLVK